MISVLNNSFLGKCVLLRVDFNVPLDHNLKVLDNSRIKSSLPTIRKLIDDGAKVVLMSHLGRPKGVDKNLSLRHVVSEVEKLLNSQVLFSEESVGEIPLSKIKSLNNGGVLLLENLRFHKEESLGDLAFSKNLASLADVYVNDAFGTAHRNHSSTSIVPQFFPNKRYCGLLLKKEVDSIKKVMDNPKKPLTAIIGGSKISTKIDVIYSLLPKVDNLIIGGAMVYTFIKSLGGKTGDSLVENEKLSVAKDIIKKSKNLGLNFLLPIDSVNANKFKNDTITEISDVKNIKDGYMGLDIGPKSIDLFSKSIMQSETIIWNGPMGVFEMSNFQKGTQLIGEAVCKATDKGSFSLVGGGDSSSAIKMFRLEQKISFLSTGGGAMLEYLKGEDLPAIKSLN